MKPRFLLVLIFILSLLFITPNKEKAAAAPPQQFNDAVVVTGQVIPAFIGGAYDPTEAFKQLAGLPIYVYTIDNFNSTAGFVTHNIAIRTQIRADGTFQAQGVTSATTKAIYFPFMKSGDNIVRTDCHQSANAGKAEWCPTNGPWDTATGYLLANDKTFRWPNPSDHIQDVFSYAYTDPGGLSPNNPNAVVVNSQICTNYPNCSTAGDFEQVVIRQSFLTTTTRLDKENTINVFPLVPHTTVSVSVSSFHDFSGATYEIAAIRATTGTLVANPALVRDQVANFPIIRGRTTPVSSDPTIGTRGVFRAYAPPGNYAIIAWRTERGALGYQDYDGNLPLNSDISGFATLQVNKDWEDLLRDSALSARLNAYPNQIIVWGVVTDPSGYVLSERNRSGTFGGDLQVEIVTDTDREYYGKAVGGMGARLCVSSDQNCGSGAIFNSRVGDQLPNHDRTWYGIYALYQKFNANIPQPPLNEYYWVYVNGRYTQPGDAADPDRGFVQGYYQSSPTSPSKIISGTDGPVRIDLTTAKSDTNQVGFNSGIHLKVEVTDPATGQNIPANTAQATIFLANPDNPPPQDIKALHRPYSADRLGWIHIPDGDLFAFPCSAAPCTGSDENAYGVIVTAAGKGDLVGPIPYQSHFYDNTTTGSGPVILSQLISPTNPYKFLGIVPIPFPLAYAGTSRVEIPVTLHYAAGMRPQGAINVFMSIDRMGEGTCIDPALDCDVGYYDTGGNWVPIHDIAMAPNNRFFIRIYRELSYSDYQIICQSRGWKPSGCRHYTSSKIGTYNLIVKGVLAKNASGSDTVDFIASQKISIDQNGLVTPTPIDLYPGIDCNKVAADAYPGGNPTELTKNIQHGFLRGATSLACKGSKAFLEKAPAAFGFVQRHVLNTYPVTEAGGVVQLWNVMRALTNILFIVILMIIAFATIFRINPKEWSLGLVLPNLIVSMVLANFSLLIIQALIDTSNIFTQSFFNLTFEIMQGLKTSMGQEILPMAGGGAATIAAGSLVAGGLASWVSTAIISGLSFVSLSGGLAVIPILVFAVLGIVAAILVPLLGLIIMLLVRYGIIWVATVLAPLVFAVSALPGKTTQGLRGMWFATLMPFVFMTPVIAFVMSLGLLLLTYSAGENSFVAGFGIAITAFLTLKLTLQAPSIVSNIFGKGLFDTKLIPGQAVDWGKKRTDFEKGAESRIETKSRRQAAAEAEERLTGRRPFSASRIGRFVPGLGRARDVQIRRELAAQKARTAAEDEEEYRARTSLGMSTAPWKNFASAFFAQQLDDSSYTFRASPDPRQAQLTRGQLRGMSDKWNKRHMGGKAAGVNAFRHLYGYSGEDRKEIQKRLDFINRERGWSGTPAEMKAEDYKALRSDIGGRGSSISSGQPVRQTTP